MAEEIDVSEVVKAIDRLQAGYRKPLIKHREDEKPRSQAKTVSEAEVFEERARS